MITTALKPPTGQPTVGMSEDIVCTVNTVSGVEYSSVLISWTGPGGGHIMNDSRVNICPTTSSGNNYTSRVQFTYLMERDEGTYVCNVMILETSGSSSYTLPSLMSKLPFCILPSTLHHTLSNANIKFEICIYTCIYLHTISVENFEV